MGHGDDDVVGTSHQVHGAAHALDQLAGDHPGSDVALHVHLEGTEHGQVDVAAADHREGLGRGEDGGALDRGDGLLAGVDHVGVDFVFSGEGAHAEQAVLGLQHHLHAFRDVVGHEGRDADTQVHVVAVFQFAGHALGHLFASQCHVDILDILVLVRIRSERCAFRCASRSCPG
ncbi:hypothetical protein D3C72_1469440 [compost metagenome]